MHLVLSNNDVGKKIASVQGTSEYIKGWRVVMKCSFLSPNYRGEGIELFSISILFGPAHSIMAALPGYKIKLGKALEREEWGQL